MDLFRTFCKHLFITLTNPFIGSLNFLLITLYHARCSTIAINFATQGDYSIIVKIDPQLVDPAKLELYNKTIADYFESYSSIKSKYF